MVDMLSQDEIDALLGGSSTAGSSKTFSNKDKDEVVKLFEQAIQKSGEVLSNLISKNVTLMYDSSDDESVLSEILGTQKCVVTSYEYKNGLKGKSAFVVKQEDAKVISDLMMGNEEVKKDEEFTDLNLSAFTEAVSQMVGASITTLTSILKDKIDVNPPKTDKVEGMGDLEKNIDLNDGTMVITYNLIVNDYITSDIYLVITNTIVEQIINKLNPPEPKKEEMSISNSDNQATALNNKIVDTSTTETKSNLVQMNNVNVKPVQFSDIHSSITQKQKENIDLIMDVPLEVTVELGRTHKSIREILEFAPGTIIELDKLAGEPIDILVNGKFVAKGEVIVIDENFGIRITEIIDVKDRL